ncbi:malate synthase G [Leucobacter chromiireducens]|uniref:Malate synthase G n=1 Tax=Leucobacter chromiireducens subsp. chromiireducens TaxID=660067 RepID=A0ABS1SQ92_9MICO|nr:malate synthase G [Leucobacter chromiireducens]MBL3690346.1 malate synthase G [Leucobacter chromiireducens subsp. chromiireducens]
MTAYASRADLSVAEPILAFAEESLSRHQIDPDTFWAGVSAIVHELAPRNAELLRTRDELQARIDAFHQAQPGIPEPAAYRAFLTEIGYLAPEPGEVRATTTNVAPEIASMAGPQLVVPILNARFALNAVNARWGSLYDALYGTDAISQEGELAPGASYNPARGAAVIAHGRELLDTIAPLVVHSASSLASDPERGDAPSHAAATAYSVVDGELRVALDESTTAVLADPATFVGYTGEPAAPTSIMLVHHGLHAEIVIDRTGQIGAGDAAGVQDIVLEAALTTIMDLEDSVAAVDAEDKALGYRNWRGLMDGSLTEEVAKGGKTFTRRMNPDRVITSPQGEELTLAGRSVLFVRNVGHLMLGDSILDQTGAWTPEGIIDAIMTALGSLDDLRGAQANSRTASMYIVKPKMHGPAEAAFTAELFARVEQLLGLPALTLKVGIMDEERRTSANLAATIAAAADRVAFINTGFLDRTGDEIHTSMHAGPFLPKAAIRTEPWLPAYEARNVTIGVACGLDEHAQIGKGMWAMPDLMAAMLEQKIGHVRAGASTAWVPSPTAATLHATHYHRVDAFAARAELVAAAAADPANAERALADLLTVPLAGPGDLDAETVAAELENSSQSILGYVVRWIDQGVGCSKVPDIHDIGLMEDRATLRISAQLLANWLLHGVISEAEVDAALTRCAAVVDRQNAADPEYEQLLGADGETPGIAFTAARRLIVEGGAQPSGYTEPLLHELRRAKKAEQAALV